MQMDQKFQKKEEKKQRNYSFSMVFIWINTSKDIQFKLCWNKTMWNSIAFEICSELRKAPILQIALQIEVVSSCGYH